MFFAATLHVTWVCPLDDEGINVKGVTRRMCSGKEEDASPWKNNNDDEALLMHP